MNKNFWNNATLNGLLLALITIILTLITTVFELNATLNVIVVVFKLIATVGALYYFMKEYGKDNDDYSYGTSFKYGLTVSFCSAVISAVYFYIHYAFLFIDKTEQLKEAMTEGFEQAGASSSMPIDPVSIQGVLENLPVLTSVGILFYYTLIGLVFAAIIANFTKKDVIPHFE